MDLRWLEDAESPAEFSKRCLGAIEVVKSVSRRARTDVDLLFVASRGADRDRGVAFDALASLARVAELEVPHLRVKVVEGDASDLAANVATEILGWDDEREVSWSEGRRRAVRVERVRDEATARTLDAKTPVAVAFDTSGNFFFRPLPKGTLAPGDVRIRVTFASLNFRDVMKVLGIYPIEPGDTDATSIGDECAGVVTEVGRDVRDLSVGDSVIARFAGRCLATELTVPRAYVFKKPAVVDDADASTLPVVFTTAWYGLRTLAGLSRGEKVLIHSAAGGVGLAAIQIALDCGAEIIGTAGSAEKRDFVRSLGVENVFSSKDSDFVGQILEVTGGEGVDVVLNSLAGPLMVQSISLLRDFGRFVELGKRDLYAHTPVGLSPFRRNVSYHAVDLAKVWSKRPAVGAAVFEEVLAAHAAGRLRPLPRVSFPLADIRGAFDHFQKGAHIGKIVVDCSRPEDAVLPVKTHSTSRYGQSIRSSGAYLVTGGLGGLGRVVVEWLVGRGARHVVVIGRSGAATPESNAFVEKLCERHVVVDVHRGSIADTTFVDEVLKGLRASGSPLRGVLHLAGVLKDALLPDVEEEHLERVFEPKVHGAYNLHNLTRSDPLDFFILFSSAVSTTGSEGQGVYAMANAYLDALARQRCGEGLPAQSLGWGVFLGSGMMTGDVARRRLRSGIGGIMPVEVAELLDRILPADEPHVVIRPVDWAKLLAERVPKRFEEFRPSGAAARPAGSLGAQVRGASDDEALAIIDGYLRALVAKIRGLMPERVVSTATFSSMGFDSLAGLTLLNRIRFDLGVSDLPVRAVFDTTIGALAAAIVARCGASPEPVGAGAASSAPAETGIPRANRADPAPLSFAQEQLWFLSQLAPDSDAYTLRMAFRLAGDLDVGALERALETTIARHETLRCRFEIRDGVPSLRIDKPYRVSLTPRDVLPSEVPDVIREPRLDLARGPLFHASLLRLSRQEHALAIVMHHIISDGWSLEVLVREITTLYEAFVRGERSPLPELPVQFVDFAAWQRAQVTGGALDAQLAYWKTHLEGAPRALELPTDRPRSSTRTNPGATEALALPSSVRDAVHALAEKERATPFMVALAAYATLLSRLSGQAEVVIGTPITQRNRAELEDLVGMFMTALPLRIHVEPGSFRSLLRCVREVTLKAHVHQDVPFDAIVEHVRPPRDLQRAPIFQTMLVALNYPRAPRALHGLTLEWLVTPLETGEAKFDITIYLNETENGISLTASYDADLFERARVVELLRQLGQLLDAATRDPDASVHECSLVTPSVRAVLPDPMELLDGSWHGAVTDAFSRVATASPERLAVADPSERWSYGELEARSNQLAQELMAKGCRRGDRVAIFAHRSASLAWALLGILKAGCAFVILDPSYPVARLAAQVRIARPRAVVQLPGAPALPSDVDRGLEAVRIALPRRSDADAFAKHPTTSPAIALGADDVAYIAFTSGSTGVPKAVVGRHGPLSYFQQWRCERFELSADDRFCMLSGLAHDPLHRDVFTPLQLGASLHVPPADELGRAGQVASWMASEGITVAHLTPSFTQLLAVDRARLPALRRVFLVGEALKRQDVARLRELAPKALVVNYYGATETQQALGYFVVGEDGQRPVIPVGRGVPGVQLLVLTSEGRLAGIGEIGEIVVRSPHLAAGYVGDEDASRAKFVVNPLSGKADDRAFRTGDLGRYLPSGDVEFAGRADHQVKIRGVRVELEEIERILMAQPGVRNVFLDVREDDAGGRTRIIAYVAPASSSPDASALRQALRRSLPGYFVPSAFVLVEGLPLTPTGKVDRGALPAPEQDAQDASTATAPSGPIEEAVAKVWMEVLGLAEIDVTASFFDLGGHSLHATQVVSRLRDILDVEVPIRAIFESPTVAELSRWLDLDDASAGGES